MKEKHGWNTLESYLKVHDSVLRKYAPFIITLNPKYKFFERTDQYLFMWIDKMEIVTAKGVHIFVSIDKEVDVQPGARKKLAKTYRYSYHSWYKGHEKDIIRYCSPHDTHNEFHHKHVYTKKKPELIKIDHDQWPHVSEFLDELISNY